MANEILGFEPITTATLFPWNRRNLTSLPDEKGNYLPENYLMDDAKTIETALAAADAHAQRINGYSTDGHVPTVDTLRNQQQSKTFSVDFDDPDEEDQEEDVATEQPE